MIPEVRELYNQQFTEEKYRSYLNHISAFTGIEPPFRLAETPVFISSDFLKKMTSVCHYILEQTTDPDFNKMTQASLPQHISFPGAEEKPSMMVFDFGICQNEYGDYIPMLIEMQGFPSLFGLQILLDDSFKQVYNIPIPFSSYLNGYTKEEYIKLLGRILLNGHASHEVILLEWKPSEQKTWIDFTCTKNYWGIETVCLTELCREGEQLYYMREGQKIPVKRIFCRVIWDDLTQDDLKQVISFNSIGNIEWVIHPNWYYRISKYTLPFLQHEYIPETFFLNEVKQIKNLNDFVLKPLYSYGGQGVEINVTAEILDKITDPEQWLWQRKVTYAPVVETPDGPARAEVRLFYFWDDMAGKYVAAHNLARLSKGEMIGTRYNIDKNWVGGSIAYFPGQ